MTTSDSVLVVSADCHAGAPIQGYRQYLESKWHGEFGADRIMWGADYPHTEGTWPNSRESIAAAVAGMPDDDARRILGLNAVEFYGLDLKFLPGVAGRIGPRKDEILPAAA